MNRMLLAGAAVAALGCASHPPPTDQVARSLAEARGAEEAGALLEPDAALHLKLAQEQIAQAKEQMEDGDNLRAEGLAARAFEDAQLAVAIAHEQAAKRRLDEYAQASTAGGEQPPAAHPAPIVPPAQPATGQSTPLPSNPSGQPRSTGPMNQPGIGQTPQPATPSLGQPQPSTGRTSTH